MTLKLRTTRVACATVDGTQDITISGFGTPVAAIFKLLRATADGTAADHAAMSFGATDGTMQWVNYCFWEHGVTTTDTYGNHAATALIRVLDAAGATEGDAAFSAWVTDGVRINWTNAPPAAYLLEVTLIGGTDAAGAYAGTYVQNAAVDGVTDITAPGFRPTDLILSRIFSNAGTMGINIGLVHEDGAGTVTQGFIGLANRDGQATSQLGSRVSNTYGIGMVLYTGEVYSPQEISAFDASGFSSTTRLNNTAAASGVVCYLALRITNHSTYKGTFTTPTATGNNAQTGPGFKPQFVMQLVGGCEANDTVYTDNRAGSFGASSADATAQYCGSISGEDGAATNNTQSLSDNQMVNLPNHDGTGRWATSFVSFDANGFTQNFTATHSTGAIWLYWAVQEEAGASPVTVALSASALSAAGQALSVVPGAVAKELLAAQLAASGPVLTLVPGAVVKALQTALLSSSGPSLSVVPGAVSIALGAANLSVTGQTITISLGGIPPITVTLAAGALTASGPLLDVVPGAVSVLFSAGTIASSGPLLDVVPGDVTIPLDAAATALFGQSASVIPGAVSVLINAAQIAANGQHAALIVPTAVTILLAAAQIAASGQDLLVSMGSMRGWIRLSDLLLYAAAAAVGELYQVRVEDRLLSDVEVEGE